MEGATHDMCIADGCKRVGSQKYLVIDNVAMDVEFHGTLGLLHELMAVFGT